MESLVEFRTGISPIQNDAMACLARAEVIERGINVGHGEGLSDWLDLVAGTEIQHRRHRGRGSERRAGDRFPAADERKRGHRHGFEHGTDEVQPAIRRECRDEKIPIERNVGGDEDEIKAALQFAERRLIAGADDVVSTEFFRLTGF